MHFVAFDMRCHRSHGVKRILIWPPIRSVSSGAPPLYGTQYIHARRYLEQLQRRCCALPLPAEPNESVPGFAFASATMSFNVFAGALGWQISTFGVTPTSARGEIASALYTASLGSAPARCHAN